MKLPVIHYDADYVPNPNPKGRTPFKEFWQVRGAVLETSQSVGETGPETDARSPRYYLVDDQLNDDRYQNMEVVDPEGWTTDWLAALTTCLRDQARP
jgi:hypothetical protein